jgi:hypothetical protein
MISKSDNAQKELEKIEAIRMDKTELIRAERWNLINEVINQEMNQYIKLIEDLHELGLDDLLSITKFRMQQLVVFKNRFREDLSRNELIASSLLNLQDLQERELKEWEQAKRMRITYSMKKISHNRWMIRPRIDKKVMKIGTLSKLIISFLIYGTFLGLRFYNILYDPYSILFAFICIFGANIGIILATIYYHNWVDEIGHSIYWEIISIIIAFGFMELWILFPLFIRI